MSETQAKRPWTQGYVQVYTGDGKGKSTAAFGLALRAAGAGLRVFIGQFAKGTASGERNAFSRFDDLVTIKQYGRSNFVKGEPSPEDREAALQGLADARERLVSGDYDVVILDEANVAAYLGLFRVDDLLELMDVRPSQVELVLTGRRADEGVMARADLVTEMRAICHYHDAGVPARKGIEA